VVRIHAADLEGAIPYLVQDLLPGGTLEDRLRHGPLPTDEAIGITIKLASGLAAAHKHGILHRDLKPENVMFNDRGEPLLVDFGVARVLASSQHLTQTGELMGTPGYMSPEQAKGSACDARADVYGLGGLLYAMVTTQPPIAPQSSVLLMLEAVVNATVESPSTFGVDLSPEVEAVCLHALAKTPAERYPTVRAFSEALAAARSTSGGASAKFRVRALAAGVLVVALAGLAAIAGLRETRPGAAGQGRTPEAPITPADPSAPASASALRDRARVALRRGDVAAATSAARLAQTLGHDDKAWRSLRGLTDLLAGETEAAKAALRGTPEEALCDAEILRRSLEHRARTGLDVLDPTGNATYVDELNGLVANAHRWNDLDPLGPVLVNRAQTTIVWSILRLGRPFSAGRTDELIDLLHKTRDMANGPGAGAVRVGWSFLLFQRRSDDLLWPEIRGHLTQALAQDDLEDPWRRKGQLLMSAITADSYLELSDLPPQGDEPLTRLELSVLEDCCRLLTDRWYPKLVTAIAERRPRAAAVAWRNAMAYCDQRRRMCNPRSLGRTAASLNTAALLILALRPREALEVLNESPIRSTHTRELKFLRAEAQLLGPGPPSQAAEHRAIALAERYRGNPFLRSLVAAIKFARGNSDGAFGTLEFAVGADENGHFNAVLRTPFWRTVEQTKLEGTSRPGLRTFLADALRRWP
jgi:hypothetical protein